MPRFLPTARQLRVFMAVVPLSLIIALPVLSQPLGLSDAWNDQSSDKIAETLPAATIADVQATQETQSSALTTSETVPSATAPAATSFVFDESGELHDMLLNRGKTSTPDLEIPPEDPEIPENPEEPEEDDAVIFEKPNGVAVEKIVFESADHPIYITAGPLNIRSGPSTNFASVGRLSSGDKVSCTGVSEEWMRIDYEGRAAYVYAEYTSKNMYFQDVSQTVYVSSSSLNLRKGPSTDADVITKLSRNVRLTRTGIGDGWSRVKTSSGQTGYVYSEYLTRNAPPSANPTSSSSSSSGGSSGATYSGDIGRVTDLAHGALGVRYVYGGASMSGFDCSGLINWIYRQVGISLPRSSYDYGRVGVSVSYGNMQPGDIIAIDHRSGGSSITHLGIYVGNGYMIHASSSNRKVVQVGVSDYMSRNPRYKLVTIRRVLK